GSLPRLPRPLMPTLFPYTTLFRSQGVRLYVLSDGGAGGGVGAIPNVDGGDQIGVAADKAVVPNGGAVLPVAVVVDQHRAAAKVEDRKSTRLNSSHVSLSYAVFCVI